MSQNSTELKIFAGNSNPPLAQEISQYLKVPLGRAVVETFSDGESKVEIKENVRGADVFVLQSTSAPGNNNLMELLLMLDAFKRASAKRITAVVPYYGYARQDRKVIPRVPISAKLVADLITTAGASRMLTVDLHSGQIQGFFNIPVDNLYATPVLLQYLKKHLNHNEVTIVSPDAGGVERARAIAARLDASLAIIDKRRVGPNVVAEMNIIGEVKDQIAILLDDMVDTAGTLTLAADALKQEGAKKILGCSTHAVLSGPAIRRIEESPLEELIVTNTIPLGADAQQCSKVKVLSVAHLIGEAIRRTHDEESISSLFV
jgi:ribose-phosphate pyrophosphokinase